ncbi:MAG: glutamine synthetase [Bacteroidetes bacterium]|nr:MAG: glutamine synthetase [Bacteroidota bacterium]
MTDLLKLLHADSPPTRIKVAVTDVDGILRGKYMQAAKVRKSLEEGFGFCNVIFGWDSNDRCYENGQVSGWHTGYPDARATLDTATCRRIPWEEDLALVLADFRNDQTGLRAVCPRTLLRGLCEQARELGYQARFGAEYEWFNFRETPQTLAAKQYHDPQPLTPGMFGYSLLRASQYSTYLRDIFEQLTAFSVPLEGLHTETGPGVYEAAIQYSEALEAADRAVLFKQGVKELAHRHGIVASFMAKWTSSLPGCSGHLHQSLWDAAGERNLFLDTSREHGYSTLLEHYLAGILHCLPHIMPMFAPTVNSYKRYVAGSWAATSASWGYENRTTALRVIGLKTTAIRLENRVPGADANPYLAIAASLAAGLYGIRHQLKLVQPPVIGNAYEQPDRPPLPKNLGAAIEQMRNSPIASELFGTAFTDHFLRTREWEWEQFLAAVTDWELQRYFELG